MTKKVNKPLLVLGSKFVAAGNAMKKGGLHINTTRFSQRYMYQFLNGKGFDKCYLADSNYYLTDWETWKNIIECDWIDKRDYLDDRYDCDDFAASFAANASFPYGLNSVALGKGTKLTDPDTGKHIGYHRHNLIFTNDKDGMHVYLYEPMTDDYVKIEKNRPTILGKWRYHFNRLEMA